MTLDTGQPTDGVLNSEIPSYIRANRVALNAHSLYSAAIAKTIASGRITITPGQTHIQLVGQGGAADSLVLIAGGTEGVQILLRGWTNAYAITVSKGGTLHLQADFIINNEYDTISLMNISPNNWVEISRSSNI